MPTPFKIAIPDEALTRLRQRIEGYRWFPAPSDEGADDWSRGCNTAYLKSLCETWLHDFDWRCEEAKLNTLPHFMTQIDGLDVHFVHVVGEAAGKRPLLITHGWPGSFVEFLDVIQPLAFPSLHGGKAEDAFDLVIPSLPGYGFSGRPGKPMGQRATAKLFRTLMTEVLGYPRFMAQGGDWGGFVTSWLGADHGDAVAAIHLNMIGFRPAPPTPQTAEEGAWLSASAAAMQAEGAYFMQQATKPQTLALALMDSPVGQAAWIIEKFHGWMDRSRGNLDTVFGRVRLLTNLMLYVATDNFATSVWYYRALLEEGGVVLPEGMRCETPTGFANFPGELVYKPPPRSWAERAYNIVHWNDVAYGGHFAAMEAPELFVPEVQAFARAVEY